MKATFGTILSLAIILGSLACSAQQAPIPFAQLERATHLSAMFSVPGDETAISPTAGSFSSSYPTELAAPDPIVSGFVRAAPMTVHHGVGSNFFLLNCMHLGMAAFDVEMTHHCIADHHCREGNPIMPSSLGAQISIDFALVGYSSFMSYRMKKHHARMWWISPTSGALAHFAGGVSSASHR